MPNFLNVKYEEYTGGNNMSYTKNKRLRIVGKIINDDNSQLKKGKVEIPKSTKKWLIMEKGKNNTLYLKL